VTTGRVNGSGQSARVSNAQGMVSVQARCTVAEALVLLTDRAQVAHRSLEEIAVAVVAGDLRFDR
jgi:hypothetical protein